MSVNSFATACFQSDVETHISDLVIPKKICIEKLDVDLKPFGASMAVAKVNSDIYIGEVEAKINRGFEMDNGNYTVSFSLFSEAITEGSCDTAYGYAVEAFAEVTPEGNVVDVLSLAGYAYYTTDICHSPGRQYQLNFQKD